MPDYAIDPDEYGDEECAFCGDEDDLVDMHIRNEGRGGTSTVAGCRSCNSSMGNKSLKPWLRRIRDEEHERWDAITDHQYKRRKSIAQLVHSIRDEKND